MRKTKILIAAGLIAAVTAAGWFSYKRATRPSQRMGRMIEAEKGAIEDAVEATGSVVPLNRVEVKPPIGGRVEQLLADEGSRVEAGSIIAWMSSNDRAAILDAARAKGPEELKRWQEAYKPTPIVAPLSGLVILRNVVVGQTVDPGTVVYAVADALIVLAQVDESDIGRVRRGMPARIVLDAFPDKKVYGKVFDILHEGKAVSNVITYGVKVRPEKVPPFFRSQMTANVGFIVGRKEDVVLVPSGVVQDAPGGGKQVMVMGPDGKPAPRPVTLGIEGGDRVEIASGLAAGERVLFGRGRYVPQQGPQTSPLTMGGRPSPSDEGRAPRPRRQR